VETADSENKLFYKQEFHANMSRKDDPIITPNRDKLNYTCVTFYPDLKKFKMDFLDDDIVSLLNKRAYDIAGVTSSKVKVFLNG
jgi:DNA topoisomerase-2